MIQSTWACSTSRRTLILVVGAYILWTTTTRRICTHMIRPSGWRRESAGGSCGVWRRAWWWRRVSGVVGGVERVGWFSEIGSRCVGMLGEAVGSWHCCRGSGRRVIGTA